MAWMSCTAVPAVPGTTDSSHSTATATATGWEPCGMLRKGKERGPGH